MFDKVVLRNIFGHQREGQEDEDNLTRSLVILITILVDDLREDDPGLLEGNILPLMQTD
jgi:hypothetical protein